MSAQSSRTTMLLRATMFAAVAVMVPEICRMVPSVVLTKAFRLLASAVWGS